MPGKFVVSLTNAKNDTDKATVAFVVANVATAKGTRDNSFYGLAIGRFFGFLGHNGGIAGYSSMMLHDPAVDTTIVALTNLSGLTGGAADTIAVKLIGHFFPDRVA